MSLFFIFVGNQLCNQMQHFLSITLFLSLYIIAFLWLKPFRWHRKKPLSTASLKFSYLIYLIILFALTYKFIFYENPDIFPEEDSVSVDQIMIYKLILLSFSYVIPHLLILIRRRFQKLREKFNIFGSIINICTILYLVFIYKYSDWYI